MSFSWTTEEKETIARASIPRELGEYIAHEDTLVIIKPDALLRDLMHEIIRRLSKIGWIVKAAKVSPGRAQWLKHYAACGVKYGDEVLQQICDRMNAYVIVIRLRGYKIVEETRKLVGATDPRRAEKYTIRADLGVDVQHNCIHASEVGEAADELLLWQEWV